MKILIAYDGSECADAALADLSRAGLPPEAEAVILSVADVWDWSTVGSESVMPAYARLYAGSWNRQREEVVVALEEAQVFATRASERVQADFPAWQVRTEHCADSPAWGVVKKADEWQPDLIVVGSHGRSRLGRLILGSVSQTVVTHAHCSVRVARRRAGRDDSPIRVLIGVDGSRYAEAAVEAIAKRTWPAGSEARIFAALDSVMLSSMTYLAEVYQEEEMTAKKIVEASATRLQGCGLTVSTLTEEGDPKRVLVEKAEEWGADSIFVGARGLRAIERFLVGSVSAAVAARAHCSVEVVRPKE